MTPPPPAVETEGGVVVIANPPPLLSLRTSLDVSVIANQPAGWCGNPSPRAPGANPLLQLPPAGYFCHQRQKYPKTPLETTFQDFLSALRPVSNLPHVPRVIGFSRVPLSVKRTVPPQLSATASLPLPRATVAAFPSTAVPGYSPIPRRSCLPYPVHSSSRQNQRPSVSRFPRPLCLARQP